MNNEKTSDLLRFAMAQMTSTDDLESNRDQMLHLLDQVPSEVPLVCFPENSLYFHFGPEPIQGITLDHEIWKPLIEKGRQTGRYLLLGSVPLQESEGISNAMILIEPCGEIKVVYRKIHLFDVEIDNELPICESDHFLRGTEPTILEILGWKWGLGICYDLRFPEQFLPYYKEPVDVVFIPASFTRPTGQAHWHLLLRARAVEGQCFVVAPAQSGEHRGSEGQERQTFGHSLLVEPWGQVLVDMQEDSPRVQVGTLDRSQIERVRQQMPMASHRRNSPISTVAKSLSPS